MYTIERQQKAVTAQSTRILSLQRSAGRCKARGESRGIHARAAPRKRFFAGRPGRVSPVTEIGYNSHHMGVPDKAESREAPAN